MLILFFAVSGDVPFGAWLVGRKGSLTAGVQYKPLSECYQAKWSAVLFFRLDI